MKLGRYFGTGVVIAGVATFGMTSREDISLRNTPVVVVPDEQVLDSLPLAATDSAASRPLEVAASARSPSASRTTGSRGSSNRSSGRSRGYRGRNRYRAHLFISIHADGASDTRASGYRVAAPRRDATGRASRMVSLLEESYGKVTGLKQLPDVTRRMENYYAFNFRRYEHALHPMTIAVILETGFLTSATDRKLIVNDPERVARGIVDAVLAFPETPAPAPSGPKGGG